MHIWNFKLLVYMVLKIWGISKAWRADGRTDRKALCEVWSESKSPILRMTKDQTLAQEGNKTIRLHRFSILQAHMRERTFSHSRLKCPHDKHQQFIDVGLYSRLSLSRIPRDSLKYFEISVLRHIRFAELGEKLIRLTTFNKYTCNWTLEVRDLLKIVWKRGEQFLLFSTIFFYLLLDFHV